MIVDFIKNAEKYCGISPEMDIALKDLTAENHLSVESDGRVTRSETDYVTVESGSFETHIQKADIHLVTCGEEKILYAPSELLEEVYRNEDADYIESRGDPLCSIILKPGLFALLFPFEAHAVHLCAKDPVNVHKVVYKITM